LAGEDGNENPEGLLVKKKILVVEDEPAVRELEKNLLRRLGYDVLTAESAEEGYKQVKQQRPDAIILDVMLAGKDGYSLARKLSSTPELSSVPIIFVTARGEAEDMIEGFRAGGKVYLTKPFSEKSLETAIHALLSSGRKPLV